MRPAVKFHFLYFYLWPQSETITESGPSGRRQEIWRQTCSVRLRWAWCQTFGRSGTPFPETLQGSRHVAFRRHSLRHQNLCTSEPYHEEPKFASSALGRLESSLIFFGYFASPPHCLHPPCRRLIYTCRWPVPAERPFFSLLLSEPRYCQAVSFRLSCASARSIIEI
jgi:hypothetical protein